MKSTKWIDQRNQYFQDAFSHYLKLWHQENKENTQGKLARIICQIREKKGKKSTVTASYISEWKRGKWFPEEYLEDIAEAFGIDVEKLTPSTMQEQYRISSDYTTELGRKLLDKACRSFGLDIAFLDAVRSLFGSEFKDVFPVWTPITLSNSIMPNLDDLIKSEDYVQNAYIRAEKKALAEAADAENNIARQIQMQIEIKDKDGNTEYRTVFLSELDLLFIRDVQNNVKDYIEYLFYKREKEMAQEVEKCNVEANHVVDGVVHFYLIDTSSYDKYYQKFIAEQPHN